MLSFTLVIILATLSSQPKQRTPPIVEYGTAQQLGDPIPLEIVLHSVDDRPLISELKADLVDGRAQIEKFFNAQFKEPIVVEVFPNRKALDKFVKDRWSAPPTEKWMVAAGVADVLVLLSPRVWLSEAVEHDPKNLAHRRGVVAHELVHVYHGQRNPTRDFDGMDDLGWLVEGMATYVSGQLEREHPRDAEEAIKLGKAPVRLKDAWSGRYRYGVSGSMVRYVDKRYGRDMLWRLLIVTKPEEALSMLKATEEEFIMSWKQFVRSESQGPEQRSKSESDPWEQ